MSDGTRDQQHHQPIGQIRSAETTDQQRQHQSANHHRQQDAAKTLNTIHPHPYTQAKGRMTWATQVKETKMRFADDRELVEIHMYDNTTRTDFAADFYDDAPTPDMDGVHHVRDARYPLDMALDMMHGEGDYETPGVNCSVEYDIIDLATGRIVETGVEQAAE